VTGQREESGGKSRTSKLVLHFATCKVVVRRSKFLSNTILKDVNAPLLKEDAAKDHAADQEDAKYRGMSPGIAAIKQIH